MTQARFKSITVFPAFSTIIVFVIFIIAGLSILPIIPLQLNPNTSLPSISVQFSSRNMPATEIEESITTVIEGALSTIDGVCNVSSQSSANSGSVSLRFDKYADMGAKRLEVISIIRQIYPSLPEGTSFPTVSIGGANENQNNDPILMYSVVSDKKYEEVVEVLNKFVLPNLENIKNVNQITVYGGSPIVYEIVYDYELMESYGVVQYNIISSIKNLNLRTYIGNIIDVKNKQHQKAIVIENRMGARLQLEDVIVLNNRGKLVRIKDFAKVYKKIALPTSYNRINGNNTINIGIEPKEGANLIELANQVTDAINKIKQNIPGGYQLLLIKDKTEFIKKEVNKLIYYSLMSIAILLGFIFLISYDYRYLLVVFISLISSVLISFFFYFIFGIQLHLFSFAGITISFGMMIDYTIIMIEHLKQNRNMNVFLAILASASTSIISLSAVYFLSDEIRIRLSDFASVIIINLSVSLCASLLLVPALFEKLSPHSRYDKSLSIKRLKMNYRVLKIHQSVTLFVNKRKIAFFTILVLCFGLPLFLLPPHITSENAWVNFYNKTIGSETYQTVLKKPIESWLGGVLQIFVQKVEHGVYAADRNETSVIVNASFSKGTTLKQTNEIILKLENYLKGINEINYFETNIQSPLNARISIFFKKDYVNTDFPSVLASTLSYKTMEFGSAEWNISGAESGSKTILSERSGTHHLYLYGFSYKELQKFALLVKKSLEKNPRVEDVCISGNEAIFRNINYEYVMGINREKSAYYNIQLNTFVSKFNTLTKNNNRFTSIIQNGVAFDVLLTSAEREQFDMWKIKNNGFLSNGAVQKLSTVGNIEKQQTSENINKSNQQCQLIIDFNYIGENDEAASFIVKTRNDLSQSLSMDFSIETEAQASSFNGENGIKNVSKNWLIFFILIAIYFVCAILFNSLLQPLAVIAMIPFTFIGVFLSFYIFGIKFDQGGYASLVLLSGLTVNSAIYFINERNVIIRNNKNRQLAHNTYFFKAFSQKITPVLLTLISTSLGLLPFLLTGSRESFWYPLAVGTISGLLFSIIGIFFILPLFFITKKPCSANLRTINH